MIRYEGFRKTYGRVLAVEGLDLEVRPGEMLALIGPNGSGKSTTLKSAVGLVRPSAGRVLVDGVDVALGPAARAGLGYLPQRISFPEGVAARDAMRLYARLRGADLGDVDRLLEPGGPRRCRGQGDGRLLRRDAPAPRHRRGTAGATGSAAARRAQRRARSDRCTARPRR